MAPVDLELVAIAQQTLHRAGVLSVVTGDVGLSYHGVDIVIHVCMQSARVFPRH